MGETDGKREQNTITWGKIISGRPWFRKENGYFVCYSTRASAWVVCNEEEYGQLMYFSQRYSARPPTDRSWEKYTSEIAKTNDAQVMPLYETLDGESRNEW